MQIRRDPESSFSLVQRKLSERDRDTAPIEGVKVQSEVSLPSRRQELYVPALQNPIKIVPDQARRAVERSTIAGFTEPLKSGDGDEAMCEVFSAPTSSIGRITGILTAARE